MKKSSFLYLAMAVIAMCFSSLALSSCGDDDEDSSEIYYSMPVDNDVKSYFYNSGPAAFFDNYKHFATDTCLVMHSLDEYNAVYKGNQGLPDIDFDNYSLIVGMCTTVSSGFELKQMYLDLGASVPTLHLNIGRTPHGDAFTGEIFYFGVFRKFNGKNIKVKTHYERY